LFPDVWPVLLQIAGKFLDSHPTVKLTKNPDRGKLSVNLDQSL
jgi:hypothetical protein